MASNGAAAPRGPRVRLVDAAEGRRVFDRAARRYLGISGAAFLRRWRAGEYPDPDRDSNVMHVAMLMPGGWA